MGAISSLSLASACLSLVSATTYLSPDQDIILPSTSSATNPLTLLGANSPYFAGPNVNGIENFVPENCYVDQVAYVVRHGSRFPDSGAYNQWVALYDKIQAADFTASGDLGFLHSWKPVLTNAALQISQESPTGWKEAFDLGYRLRTKYPDLYTEGTPFISWANLYPRVVQTAQNFVRGFLGNSASTLGSVVTVNSTGSPLALFDSLSPSDLCPNFVDASGGTNATTWDAIYLPPITSRLNALLHGNLTLTDDDTSLFPYLCGFESQILGTLSPFCNTFTTPELLSYQYRQDLRYYYGTGPGVDLPSKMMLPFLSSLTTLLTSGPKTQGIYANGTNFTLPGVITAFLNDGQISELVTSIGVFDSQAPLSAEKFDNGRIYVSSHFVTMRGTVAFERLNCIDSSPSSSSLGRPTSASSRYHQRDNYHQGHTISASTPAMHSTSSTKTPASTPAPTGSANGNQTYIRILLNDAVYPVPSCQDGPGKSCLLSSYKEYVEQKLEGVGDLKLRCNVTSAVTPATLKGASFFVDLRDEWVATVGV